MFTSGELRSALWGTGCRSAPGRRMIREAGGQPTRICSTAVAAQTVAAAAAATGAGRRLKAPVDLSSVRYVFFSICPSVVGPLASGNNNNFIVASHGAPMDLVIFCRARAPRVFQAVVRQAARSLARSQASRRSLPRTRVAAVETGTSKHVLIGGTCTC